MAAKRPPALDRIDIKILAALQAGGRMTIKELAETVGLSARPCLERVRRLEGAGIISGYQAVIDLTRLGRPVTVFSEITLEKHGHQEDFERHLKAIEEAVESWEVTGASDYLVRFVCADLARYESLTTALIDNSALGVARIVSHIALRAVRPFSGYPALLLRPQG